MFTACLVKVHNIYRIACTLLINTYRLYHHLQDAFAAVSHVPNFENATLEAFVSCVGFAATDDVLSHHQFTSGNEHFMV